MNCLLLERGLPDTIDGVPIYADFRNMIRLEQILDDDSLGDVEKTVLGVQQLFDQLPEGGIARAADRLLWFYHRGQDASELRKNARRAANGARAYDLISDAGCIYAAFLQAYRIDLTEVPFLHWWAFLALLENLPEETPMAQLMRLRTMDLGEIKDKEMRAHYQKRQRQVALPRKAATRDGRVERMPERVKRRYAQAQQELERRRSHGV